MLAPQFLVLKITSLLILHLSLIIFIAVKIKNGDNLTPLHGVGGHSSSMTMKNLRLSFKYKLLLGITLSILIVFGTGGVVANWLIQDRLLDQARQQMEVTGQGIHAMVRSLVVTAAKNYLKGLSETNLRYVEHAYARFKAGEISERQAKDQAESFMLKQKIGSSGYVTAVDVSNGGIKLAVHPYFKGRDLSHMPFAQQMARQKNGYLEFEWQNPDEPKSRLKSEWMSFFEPWQWIISAAPFRDEYPQLVDLAGIESELAKAGVPGKGYVFILDTRGTLLSHPSWKNRNIIDMVDADTGAPFVRQMIDSIQQARLQNRPEGLAGVIQYRVKAPEGDRIYARMMNYRYVPEVDWIVGVVTDLDQLAAPLAVVRNTLMAVMAASILLALLVVVWSVRPMTRSIGQLAAAVDQIDGGHLDTPLPLLGSDEIGRLSSAFSRMAQRLSRYTDDLEQRVVERTTELEEVNCKLALLSNTDGLTGLANRRRFDEVLGSEWARAKRSGQPLALIMLDVDYFKKYNDRYGHQAGDECLKKVASMLEAQARRASDLVARYGGEEFALILAGTDASVALCLAEAVRQTTEAMDMPHELSSFGRVTVSAGVATMNVDSGWDAEGLLRAADLALYRAKDDGRNCVVVAVEQAAS